MDIRDTAMSVTIDIDERALCRLLATSEAMDTIATGRPGGWCIEINADGTRGRLVSKRGNVRHFSRFETLATYLQRLGVVRFKVEASGYEPAPVRQRPDAASRMQRAHEIAQREA